MAKIRVCVLCGGRSAEHAISLISARNVVAALDQELYDVQVIGIRADGRWFLQHKEHFLAMDLHAAHVALPIQVRDECTPTRLAQEHAIDVVFPVLHGTYGEDGTVQGLLKLADVPFVGASVLGSAIGMDKDVTKRLLQQAGIPVADFITITRQKIPSFDEVVATLGLPLFVKPANAGSSVGVSKVNHADEWINACAHAFHYDRKVLVERAIVGRELECAVLGNAHPIASCLGELIPQDEFYSYKAKYLMDEGALFEIPASIPSHVMQAGQAMAINAYRSLCCEGMARVDFFMEKDGSLLINEINTIPGFTSVSMYPKLWQASGLAYSELLNRLIALAIERHQEEKLLKTSL